MNSVSGSYHPFSHIIICENWYCDMEEGRYLGAVGVRRDCGVLLGVCLEGISSICLSFTGCTVICHKLWQITDKRLVPNLWNNFAKQNVLHQ